MSNSKKEFNNSALVVNLFGVPSSGKSTGAAYIFAKLKSLGYNAELVTEFAKDKVWEDSKEVFNSQAYIFGKQNFKLSRCMNKVEVIVTDSPILLSAFYNKSGDVELVEALNNCIFTYFKSYNNLNFFLNRTKPYNPIGRFQDEAGSDALVSPLKDLLVANNIDFSQEDGDFNGYDLIVWKTIDAIKKQRSEYTEWRAKNEIVLTYPSKQNVCSDYNLFVAMENVLAPHKVSDGSELDFGGQEILTKKIVLAYKDNVFHGEIVNDNGNIEKEVLQIVMNNKRIKKIIGSETTIASAALQWINDNLYRDDKKNIQIIIDERYGEVEVVPIPIEILSQIFFNVLGGVQNFGNKVTSSNFYFTSFDKALNSFYTQGAREINQNKEVLAQNAICRMEEKKRYIYRGYRFYSSDLVYRIIGNSIIWEDMEQLKNK